MKVKELGFNFVGDRQLSRRNKQMRNGKSFIKTVSAEGEKTKMLRGIEEIKKKVKFNIWRKVGREIKGDS